MPIGETLGLYFEIAADPSKAIRAVSDFQNSIEKSLGMARGSVSLIAQDIEMKWGLASGSLLRTGVAAQAAVKDLAYLTAGAGALAAGALVLADRWATAGTEIFEAAEKTGMSASNLSGLRTSAKLLGEDFNSLALTVSRMGKNITLGLMDPGSGAGKVLKGLFQNSKELTDLGLKPMDERVALVTKRIFELNDVGQRNVALTALASRGWMGSISSLQDLAANGYDPLVERAKKLGQYFDEETARKAREFKIQMAEMKAEFESLGLAIGQNVVPALSQLFSLLETKLDKAMNQGLWSTTTQHVRDFASGIFNVQARILTLNGAYGLFSDKISTASRWIAGGADETQHMTDRLTSLNSMAAAAAKGTGDLGDAFKKTGKEAKEATSEIPDIIRLYNKLNIELTSENAAYRTYLNTLVEINKIHDIHSRQVLGELNDQVLLQAITQEQTKLAKEQVELRTKETGAIKAETTEIGLFGGSWEQAVAHQMKIHPETLALIKDMNLAGISMEKVRTEAIRVFGLGLPGQLNISKKALTNWANDTKLHFSGAEMAMVALRDPGTQTFTLLSQAMGMSIANAIVYGSSIKEAMAQALKSTLASIAAESLIRALYNTALGFYYLALTWGVPNSASLAAFTSAAYFGAIGGAAAIAGRAIPGGGQKVAGPTPYGAAGGAAGYTTGVATGAAAGGGSSIGQRGPTTIFNIEGIDPSKMYSGQQLKDLVGAISDAVKNNGVVLHASTAERTVRRA